MKKTLRVLVVGLALILGGCGGDSEEPQVDWSWTDDIYIKPPPPLTWCYEKDMYGNIWKKPCD